MDNRIYGPEFKRFAQSMGYSTKVVGANAFRNHRDEQICLHRCFRDTRTFVVAIAVNRVWEYWTINF